MHGNVQEEEGEVEKIARWLLTLERPSGQGDRDFADFK